MSGPSPSAPPANPPRATGVPRENRCCKCGADAPWGFGVNVPKGSTGQWACAAHKGELAEAEAEAARARAEAARIAMTPAQGSFL